jgi:hypothetical protein
MAQEVGRNRSDLPHSGALAKRGTDMTTLPDKPSELLTLALADLESVEKDPRYRVDMGDWHKPYPEYCSVCLAGAVMAQTINMSPKKLGVPSSFSKEISGKLLALDAIRRGFVALAVSDLGIELPDDFPDYVPVAYYERDRNKFFSDMRAMAALLREHGL